MKRYKIAILVILALFMVGAGIAACAVADLASEPFSVPAPPAPEPIGLPGPNVPDGLGVNIHWTNPRPGEMRMLAATGVRWIRMDFGWAATERKKGRYTFSAYVRLLSILRRYHIGAVLILDYGNPLYQHGAFPSTPAARRAFTRWAVAAATKFRQDRIIWEMWNEPNDMGHAPRRAYATLAVQAGRAIHRADPAAVYVGPALAGINYSWLLGHTAFAYPILNHTPSVGYVWLRSVLRENILSQFSGVTVHPYRHSPPETVSRDYESLYRLIDRRAPAASHLPILSGEWGYSTVWLRHNARRQGKYLAREFLINLMDHIPLSIWYDWHDDGTSPTNQECHFGMVRFAYHPHRHWVYTPKPAFFACRALIHALGGFHFEKRLRIGGGRVFALVFAAGKQRRWVVWRMVRPKPGKGVITLTVPAGIYRVADYLGAEHVTARAGAAGLKLQLSTGPQYVIRRSAK